VDRLSQASRIPPGNRTLTVTQNQNKRCGPVLHPHHGPTSSSRTFSSRSTCYEGHSLNPRAPPTLHAGITNSALPLLLLLLPRLFTLPLAVKLRSPTRTWCAAQRQSWSAIQVPFDSG
jgi:hypothetical protein